MGSRVCQVDIKFLASWICKVWVAMAANKTRLLVVVTWEVHGWMLVRHPPHDMGGSGLWVLLGAAGCCWGAGGQFVCHRSPRVPQVPQVPSQALHALYCSACALAGSVRGYMAFPAESARQRVYRP